MSDKLKIGSIWNVECVSPDGQVKWKEVVENIVVNEGLDFLLNTLLSGAAYTASWFTGLKGPGLASSGNTLDSHVAWPEITDYIGARKATPFNPAAAGIVDNITIRPEFDITVSGNIDGMFLCDAATGTVGTLFSIVDFAAPRSVLSGDILRVGIIYQVAGS